MESHYELRQGQEVKIEETNLRVRLVSVDEDSRCPVGVDCVWAGSVRISLSLSLDESEGERMPLDTALEPRAIEFDGYRITIAGVVPLKFVDKTIEPDEYVITLAVARK